MPYFCGYLANVRDVLKTGISIAACEFYNAYHDRHGAP
jgi:hypothetical protein